MVSAVRENLEFRSAFASRQNLPFAYGAAATGVPACRRAYRVPGGPFGEINVITQGPDFQPNGAHAVVALPSSRLSARMPGRPACRAFFMCA
jgi:hypothetical protein